MGRLEREHRTIRAMIGLWCRRHHGEKTNLCPDCENLLTYARSRLEKCPYEEKKPTCGRCSVHCYKQAMRTRVREVMRYAGPRMLGHHPLLAVLHILDGLRKAREAKK